MLEEYGSTEGNIMVDYQSKMRLTLENLLMICWQDAHNQSDSSWKNQISRMIISNFFMMNQTTPHLGARSGLMNNESSN